MRETCIRVYRQTLNSAVDSNTFVIFFSKPKLYIKTLKNRFLAMSALPQNSDSSGSLCISTPISEKELHIWRIDFVNSGQQTDEFYKFLSEDERARADSFFQKCHRENFILMRGALRKIIGMYLVRNPSDIEFSYNEYGKPSLKKGQGSLYFNVSHSGDLGLCVICKDGEVGIDIEKILEIDNFESIAAEFFSPNEYAILKRALPVHKLATFYQIWTRKEAIVKAIGRGLSYPLKSFDAISGGGLVVIDSVAQDAPIRLNLMELEIKDGYLAAIAYGKHPKETQLYRLWSAAYLQL